MAYRTPAFLACMAYLAFDAAAAAQVEPLGLLDTTNIKGGLLVHVGVTDGQMEEEIARRGTFLVHGLALDDGVCEQARSTIIAKGKYGLASVATWYDRRQLPYASNVATAVVADLDSLGSAAPEQSDLLRIVAPEGALIMKKDGTWRVSRKPRPVAMDDWRHFDHGADGNPVSQDMLVAPVRQQQWITGVQPNPFEGNPAGYVPGGGVCIWGRYAIMDVNNAYDAQKPNDRDTWVLQGRDAFNGVTLWSVARGREVAGRRWSLAAADGEVYARLERDGELTVPWAISRPMA